MIPWLIFAVVIVPLVVVGFAVTRRRSASELQRTSDAETEPDFSAAEAYEADWHKADEERFHKERLP